MQLKFVEVTGIKDVDTILKRLFFSFLVIGGDASNTCPVLQEREPIQTSGDLSTSTPVNMGSVYESVDESDGSNCNG